MRPVLILALSVALCGSHALAQDQSGRFAVFGPSAEREAFFQGQRDAEAARVERIEEQRREAELARDLARAEAEARKAEAEALARANAPQGRRYVRRCFLTKPQREDRLVVAENFGDAPGFPARVRSSNLPGRVVCPNYVFVPADPYGTDIRIDVDDGEASGRIRIRRPGLRIDLTAD